MFITLMHEGKTYRNFQPDDLVSAGVPQNVVDEAVSEEQAALAREQVRFEISSQVGDTASLVGTVADGAGLLIAMALADVVALSTTTSFAEYKKAKLDTLGKLAGDSDFAWLAAEALKKIQSGDVILTASLKGLETVIAESLARSTAVATILAQQNEASADPK